MILKHFNGPWGIERKLGYTEKTMTFSNWVFVFLIWGSTQFKYKIYGKNSCCEKLHSF